LDILYGGAPALWTEFSHDSADPSKIGEAGERAKVN
jgi:hypothetical protein